MSPLIPPWAIRALEVARTAALLVARIASAAAIAVAVVLEAVTGLT